MSKQPLPDGFCDITADPDWARLVIDFPRARLTLESPEEIADDLGERARELVHNLALRIAETA